MGQPKDPGGHTIPELEELPPPDVGDPIVQAYRNDIDVSLLRENLRLSVLERMEKLVRFMRLLEELRRGGATPSRDER